MLNNYRISEKLKILFFGCGKMGSAILQNFLDEDIDPKNITIIDPFTNNNISKIKYFSNISEISEEYKANLVIFAFKPQEANRILPEIIKYDIFHEKTIFISILAGKKIEFFTKFLGDNAKIIRIMPNLPMSIGEGISGFVANKNLIKDEAKSVMHLWSKNIELKSEEEINLFTAIASSGPAYLFLFAKSLIKATLEYGIDKESARIMTVNMLYGSSKMLLDDNLDISNLIDSVKSKGGTTEAGLNELNQGNFEQLIKKTVKAAYDKATELGETRKL